MSQLEEISYGILEHADDGVTDTINENSDDENMSTPSALNNDLIADMEGTEDVKVEVGCVYVVSAFHDFFLDRGRVISSLVEATDVYLLGTVMLVFGMGLYELFISNLDKAKSSPDGTITYRSNLFGLFTLKERPRWLEIKTVNELKTKLGHVIVMLLLIGLFDKSKKAVIQTPLDLLCFAASVLLSSGCLLLLSKLNE
ncbi:hypothetical protein BUALT_Bualt10G0080500 [Buddleja alternifolia]|uniref:Uncharacterized protein n=1 Tax=Buddleja alternifolia TaxID=168488 RepID=A0AAV6X7U5_9LAMI|nr:hypothetical protein BUALT_Bualt10G0080500 [Buddleja alternifolia]